MENLLVAAIVLVALVSVVRQLIKKFCAPKSNCCNGGCGTCNRTFNQKEKMTSC
jgi:hypothetical protein